MTPPANASTDNVVITCGTNQVDAGDFTVTAALATYRTGGNIVQPVGRLSRYCRHPHRRQFSEREHRDRDISRSGHANFRTHKLIVYDRFLDHGPTGSSFRANLGHGHDCKRGGHQLSGSWLPRPASASQEVLAIETSIGATVLHRQQDGRLQNSSAKSSVPRLRHRDLGLRAFELVAGFGLARFESMAMAPFETNLVV